MAMRPIGLARMCLIAGVAFSAMALVGCGGVDPRAASVLEPDAPDDVSEPGSGVPAPVDDPQSVDDVAPPEGGAEDPTGSGDPPDGQVAVRVRNLHPLPADVTALFLSGGVTIHIALVTVPAHAESVIAGPADSEQIALSGRQGGQDLVTVVLRRGEDFDLLTQAIWVVELPQSEPGDPGDSSGGDPGSGDPPAQGGAPGDAPPSIELMQPARDQSVTLGSTIAVAWTDFSPTPATIVIRLIDVEGTGEAVPISPPLAERGDGLNDQTEVIVQGVAAGEYLVVAEISAEGRTAQSVAPGRVRVTEDQFNDAPTVRILSPVEPMWFSGTADFDVVWEDEDDDDDAIIEFRLEEARSDGGRTTYPVSGTFREDPDGLGEDAASLMLIGMLPGTYDLVAHISDGELAGSHRVPGVIEIVVEPLNDYPTLALREPAAAVSVLPGREVVVAWVDSDQNDNALITLMLDPDQIGTDLDGDEIILAASISEDPDGVADRLRVTLPGNLPPGEYRLAGSITDGDASAVSFAPGGVRVGVQPENPPPDPSLTLDGLSPPLALRMGDVFHVSVVIADAPAGELTMTLANDSTPIEVFRAQVPAAGRAVVNVEVDSDVLELANDYPIRWFNVTATLTGAAGVVLSDTVPAAVWIRQELSILGIDYVNIECDQPRQPNEPPVERGMSIRWYGGGYLTGGVAPAPVEFWLARDGAWPPDDPSGGNGLHHMLFKTVESPGVTQETWVAWSQFVVVPPGHYAVLGVVDHPDFGQLVEVYPMLIEICQGDVFGEMVGTP